MSFCICYPFFSIRDRRPKESKRERQESIIHGFYSRMPLPCAPSPFESHVFFQYFELITQYYFHTRSVCTRKDETTEMIFSSSREMSISNALSVFRFASRVVSRPGSSQRLTVAVEGGVSGSRCRPNRARYPELCWPRSSIQYTVTGML